LEVQLEEEVTGYGIEVELTEGSRDGKVHLKVGAVTNLYRRKGKSLTERRLAKATGKA